MNDDKIIKSVPSTWENISSLYASDFLKNKLPEFYNFYDIKNDFKNVYEPSDDTFLLIDSLELEIKNMNKMITSLEIG